MTKQQACLSANRTGSSRPLDGVSSRWLEIPDRLMRKRRWVASTRHIGIPFIPSPVVREAHRTTPRISCRDYSLICWNVTGCRTSVRNAAGSVRSSRDVFGKFEFMNSRFFPTAMAATWIALALARVRRSLSMLVAGCQPHLLYERPPRHDESLGRAFGWLERPPSQSHARRLLYA